MKKLKKEAIKSKDLSKKGRAKGDKQQLKEVSKKIKKCITDKKRTRRQEQIQRILEEFRCIKNILNIKSARKKRSFQR